MRPVVARPGRVVTFYSYKGGTGRSLALSNVAWILASAGKRVLVMDWDLEAPGLHRYFKPFLIDHELAGSDGLMDLIDNYATEAIRPPAEGEPLAPDWWKPLADFENYVLAVDFDGFPPGGRIDLLPAGRQSDTYAVKVSAFNWQNFYDRLGGGGFLEEVRSLARQRYDYVLVDSRTGVSDTAGISTAQMPDSLVVCFTYNNQSIKGAAAVAASARATQAALSLERARRLQARSDGSLEDTPAPFRIFPIPMRVHDGERDRLESRRGFARAVFGGLLDPQAIPNPSQYWSEVEVPHKLHYAYEEVLAPLMEDAHDPKTVLSSFVRITRYLTDGEVRDYQLPLAPERRQALLEVFARTSDARLEAPTPAAQAETEEQALVRAADTALLALGEEEHAVALGVLSRLVRIGRSEEGGRRYPIRVALAEIPERQRGVVAALSAGRVLAISTELRPVSGRTSLAPEQVLGLVDERLVAQWPALARWLDADAAFLLWRQQLRDYRNDWNRTRDAGALMSGSLLAEARAWALRRPQDLNEGEAAFIRASAEEAERRLADGPSGALATMVREAPAALAAPPTPPTPPSRSSPWKTVSTTAAVVLAAVVVVPLLVSELRRPGNTLPPPASAAITSSSAPSSDTRSADPYAQAGVGAQQKEAYAATVVLQLAPSSEAERKRRAQTQVEYFAHVGDDEAVRGTLDKLGFVVRQLAPKISSPSSNVVWYGSRTNADDVKLVACALIQAGAAVKDIRPISPDLAGKADQALIQVGASAYVADRAPLTVEQVTQMKLATEERGAAVKDY